LGVKEESLKTDSFHKTKNKFFPLDTSMALPRGSSFDILKPMLYYFSSS
ncbi:MAG: hypothetical protein ACI9Y7_002697, partial [Dokdonia sp.]